MITTVVLDGPKQSVIEQLKRDSKAYARLEEYLKYENQIYSNALDMHKRQMEWLRRQKKSKREGGST